MQGILGTLQASLADSMAMGYKVITELGTSFVTWILSHPSNYEQSIVSLKKYIQPRIGDRGTSRLHKCVTQNSHIIIPIAGITPSVHMHMATWEFLMPS